MSGSLLSRPDNLTPFPGLPRVKSLELLNGAGLDADHPGVLIIREIRHPLSLLAPRVPHGDGVKALSNNRQPRFIRLGIDDGHRRGRVDVEVDAIGFTGDSDRGRRFFLESEVIGFVGVGLGLEVLDADFVDILTNISEPTSLGEVLERNTGTVK